MTAQIERAEAQEEAIASEMSAAFQSRQNELGNKLMHSRAAAAEKVQQLQAERQRRIEELLNAQEPPEIQVQWDKSVTQELQTAWGPAIERFRRLVGTKHLQGKTIRLHAKKMLGGWRSHYVGSPHGVVPQVNLDPEESAGNVGHELGHWFEAEHPDILEKALNFRWRRTLRGTLEKKPLSDYGKGYGPDEETQRDWFMNAYIGKVPYETKKGKPWGTEIVSEGIRYLLEDPVTFAREDPDHFHFMFDLLRGNE